MSDQQLIKKQSSQIMWRTALLFISIFTIFIFVLTVLLNVIWYSQVDQVLRNRQQMILTDTSGGVERLLIPKNLISIDQSKDENLETPLFTMSSMTLSGLSMLKQSSSDHLIEALYDTTGELINEESLGEHDARLVNRNFTLDIRRLNHINEYTTANNNIYRTLIFKVHDDGTYYVQLIVDVTNETILLSTYTIIVVSCGIVLVLIAIILSRHIAKSAMSPIIEGWHRQSDFIGNASHELRTPLAIIQSRQEQLLTKPFDQIIDHAEHISITLNETKRLTKLTADLLTLSKLESGENILHYETFDIIPTLTEIKNVYSEVAIMQEKTLCINAPEQLMIVADKARIHQLIIILLDNALKYTEQGDNIEINAHINGQFFELNVIDDGIGVSQDNIHKLKERFFREDKARSRALGGAGLGLSIASWIVNAHRGTLTPQHNYPKGMIFKVSLPIKKLKELQNER